jgi:hypothetical protein
MPEDANLSTTSSSTQRLYDDRLRTPVIEDQHHPLNLWRTEGEASQRPRIHERFDQLRERHRSNGDTVEAQRLPDVHGHLPWRERVKHTTWAYFTLTMATGGLANVLHTGMSSIRDGSLADTRSTVRS